MATKLTQGKLAKLKGLIYPHTLDIRAFTLCLIPVHLQHLLLAEDQANSVDLSGCMFRMHRAVGGSWTEYLKTDKELFHLAEAHATAAGPPSIRTCPFCRVSQGTPRHFVMECSETKEYAEDICDAVEVVLSSLGCTQVLIDAANKHFHGAIITPSYLPSDQCASRWPIHSAWHWLVQIPAKEAVLNALPAPDSDTSEPESPMDLAYRCVLPSPIGYAIHKIEVPRVSEPTIEDVATLLDAPCLSKEAEDRIALWRKQRPAIMVVTALALGLRRLRAEVRRRVDAWKILAASAASAPQAIHLPSTGPDVQPLREVSPTPCGRNSFSPAFATWATSTGASSIRTLRWAIPSRDSAIERTRRAAKCATLASAAKIAEPLTSLGVPFTSPYGPSWGPSFTEWKSARRLFHVPCDCVLTDVYTTTSAFSRCFRSHCYSMQNEPPVQAMCKSCGRNSDTVCAACHNGFHNMAQCGLASGVNKEYFPDPTEQFPVCPDCMWNWVQFLSTCPTKISPLH